MRLAQLVYSEYSMNMRTTISISDRLAKLVRRTAGERGMSVSAFIAEILDDAVKRQQPPREVPFRLVTVGGGGPLAGIDLDRPRALDLADDEAARKR